MIAMLAGAGGHGARGSLESALPGEWAAFFVVLAALMVVGMAILVATCLGHERVVARRRAARARSRAMAGSGTGAQTGAGTRVGVSLSVGADVSGGDGGAVGGGG